MNYSIFQTGVEKLLILDLADNTTVFQNVGVENTGVVGLQELQHIAPVVLGGIRLQNAQRIGTDTGGQLHRRHKSLIQMDILGADEVGFGEECLAVGFLAEIGIAELGEEILIVSMIQLGIVGDEVIMEGSHGAIIHTAAVGQNGDFLAVFLRRTPKMPSVPPPPPHWCGKG